jgi:hypothetical protein
VILSAEPSAIGALNLLSHCWSAAMHLLTKGLLCRGYVMRGAIHHRGQDVFGSGHLDVMDKEKAVSIFKQDADERGTPFIEVDPEVTGFIEANGDDCTRKMFSRFVRRDGDLVAVFPFAALSHSFMIAGLGMRFNPDEERQSNNNLRLSLQKIRAKIEGILEPTDEQVRQKTRHYIAAIDAQIKGCDDTDAMIDRLCRPFGRTMTKENFPGLFPNE